MGTDERIISFGDFAICLTCKYRRRWSTGKTRGAYCTVKPRPKITAGLLGWQCSAWESKCGDARGSS